MTKNVEAEIAKHTVRRAVFVGPILVLVMGLWRGGDGAIAASIGVAVVVGNFLLAGAILSIAARISLGFYHAAALFGFVLRLALIAVTMIVIARLTDADRLAMGITVVVAYLVLLGWETVAVARGSERELEWSS